MDAIVRHEGIRLTAYRDSAGLLTIGVGHLLTKSELSSGKIMYNGTVRWKDGITEAQAFELLSYDLAEAEAAVERYAPGLNDAQFDALVSFVFNIGVVAFERSTLLQKIQSGHLDEVPPQMLRWDRAAGVRVVGLARRREDEAALWNTVA